MGRDVAEHISWPDTLLQRQENNEHPLRNSDGKETKRLSFGIDITVENKCIHGLYRWISWEQVHEFHIIESGENLMGKIFTVYK